MTKKQNAKYILVGKNGMRYSSKYYYAYDGFIYLKLSDSRTIEVVLTGEGNPPLDCLLDIKKERCLECM